MYDSYGARVIVLLSVIQVWLLPEPNTIKAETEVLVFGSWDRNNTRVSIYQAAKKHRLCKEPYLFDWGMNVRLLRSQVHSVVIGYLGMAPIGAEFEQSWEQGVRFVVDLAKNNMIRIALLFMRLRRNHILIKPEQIFRFVSCG